MHGLIFEGFRSFLVEEHGAAVDSVDSVFGGRARYELGRAYADEEFVELLERAAAHTGLERRELLLVFGSFAARRTFADLYPEYYATSVGTRPFLLSVEDRIHTLVRRAVADAQPPRLHVTPFGRSGVAITYTSDRRLCDLLEGLVHGTAEHYGERATIEQPQCMLRGDLACAFFVEIESGDAQPPV